MKRLLSLLLCCTVFVIAETDNQQSSTDIGVDISFQCCGIRTISPTKSGNNSLNKKVTVFDKAVIQQYFSHMDEEEQQSIKTNMQNNDSVPKEKLIYINFLTKKFPTLDDQGCTTCTQYDNRDDCFCSITMTSSQFNPILEEIQKNK